MHDVLLEGFPEEPVSVSLVWMEVLPLDGEEAARRAASRLVGDDPRVHHFLDPEGRVGDAVSDVLGWEHRAWDIYLFFPAGVSWNEAPPEPFAYLHQLPAQAQDGMFYTGEDLNARLREAMTRLSGPDSPSGTDTPDGTRDGERSPSLKTGAPSRPDPKGGVPREQRHEEVAGAQCQGARSGQGRR